MKHLAVANLEITDHAWVPEYVERTTKMVERHGGRYLTRTTRIDQLEGDREPPQIVLVIEWPSEQAATGFYESAEYRPLLEMRKNGSTGDFWLVPAEDVNGVARIDP
ncbi:MAG: DUF1330 domain-containing protein [Solirubrobacterales bacterium]